MDQIDLLKMAVEEAEKKNKIKLLNTNGVKKIFEIVNSFIKKHKCICYGGTAINNILPLKDQFYSSYDIPDYDFFSKTPMDHAIELCDIYYKHGFKNVESKSGVHVGTYKVFVDFIPVADITFIEPQFFDIIIKDCIKKGDILYAPPNFLRMAMYVELSRPDGDVSRWEKVYKRLQLLNKHYPIKETCNPSSLTLSQNSTFNVLLKTLLKEKVVFFGGHALSIYSEIFVNAQPFFDVISTQSKKVANECISQLKKSNIHATIIIHEEIEGYVGKSYEINVDGTSIVFIYEPVACYNYNTIMKNGNKINIATTDTMLSFYFMFLYINQKHYDPKRIICMCQHIIKLQDQGKLKRFTLKCIGTQKTQRDIFMEKDLLYKKYKNDKTNKNFIEVFFRYNPIEAPKKTAKPKSAKPKTATKPKSMKPSKPKTATKPKSMKPSKPKSDKPLRRLKRKTKKNLLNILKY